VIKSRRFTRAAEGVRRSTMTLPSVRPAHKKSLIQLTLMRCSFSSMLPINPTVGHMTKILLVDDSKFLRLATERSLARAGYSVSTASDGEQALRLARETVPDLILLDMLLPKMTGPDVLKALKSDPVTAGIAVVVFTGLSQKNAARLEKDGAFAFLEKSEMDLDKGCERFLGALAHIVRKLNLEVPDTMAATK